MPSFVRGMRNDWAVQAEGDSTARVTSRISAKATGLMGAVIAPMMRMKLRSTQRRIFEDLRVYAERGAPSDRKQRAIGQASPQP